MPKELGDRLSHRPSESFARRWFRETACNPADAHDGKILKDVLKQYAEADVNILSFCLNLDGANKYNSNELSVWPIQLLPNYLPPNIRFLPNNIIVSGLYYNNTKPNCHEFMLPLINELNDLNARKITMDIDGEEFVFKPVITHCSVDLPAKSMLQQTKQFGSYNGCTYCDIHGELIAIQKSSSCTKKAGIKKTKVIENSEAKPNPKRYVRYVEGDEQPLLRNEFETLKTMLAVSSSATGEAVDGVKGKEFNIFKIIFRLKRTFISINESIPSAYVSFSIVRHERLIFKF